VQLLTESAIRHAVLGAVNSTVPGDAIDIAMFYLSERDVVETLIEAAQRGIAVRLILDPNKDSFGRTRDGVPNRPAATELVRRSGGMIQVRWYRTHGEQFHSKLVVVRHADRVWVMLGSANLTRRNIGNYNLEADVAVNASRDTALAQDVQRYFDMLWVNDPVTLREYTSDFSTYEDQSFGRYWRYRLMEATGLSTF
jgi:phosphatidylserine/phosphatidylglycerophosphate/cardiolipin synthase-like enzyme